MKKSFIGWILVVGLVGCSESELFGPSAKQTDSTTKPVVTTVKKPVVDVEENTFNLSVPFESITLTQGKEETVLIGINRGENFSEKVSIKVSDLPPGVTMETVDPVIQEGDTEVTLNLKANSDAALGDFTVKLTGHTASSGADFPVELRITVAKE